MSWTSPSALVLAAGAALALAAADAHATKPAPVCLTDISAALRAAASRERPPDRSNVRASILETNDDQDLSVIRSCSGAGCPVSVYDEFHGRRFYDVDPDAAAALFFESHPDTATSGWDVVSIWTAFPTTFEGGAYYRPVANDVRGINGGATSGFDETYNANDILGTGSKGYMRGEVFMGDWYRCEFVRRLGLPCDDTPPYDESFMSVFSTLGQEVLHRWAAFVEFKPDGIGAASSALLGRDLSHWSYYLDTGGSPMEGNDWEETTPSSFELKPTEHTRFSPLDQYLMGVRAAEDVPDLLLIKNPVPQPCTTDPDQYMQCQTSAGTPPGEGDTHLDGSALTVSIADIIAVHGERAPAFPAAPQVYKIAFMLIETEADSATSADLTTLSAMRKGWTRYFYEASGRRMRALTTLDGRDDMPFWDFTISGEGFSGVAGAAAVPADPGGKLVLTPTGDEAGFENANVSLDAATLRSAHVVLTVSTDLPAGPGRLVYSAASTGFTTTGWVDFQAIPDGKPHRYAITLENAPGWVGTVRGLRLVPELSVPQPARATPAFALESLELLTTPADDADVDAIPDADDNCPNEFNPSQRDASGNGVGDACDPDRDGDGSPNDKDFAPDDPKVFKDPGSGGGIGGCGCGSAGAGGPALFGLAAAFARLTRRRVRS